MSEELVVEQCPETGICTIRLSDGAKVDLMPDEVAAVRDAEGNLEQVREAIAESDMHFAAGLSPDVLGEIAQRLQ